MVENTNPDCEPHPAIMLVSAYLVERGLIPRYYISDLSEDATSFARRIRGYWGVENKVHYCKDVTMGEDQGSIRTEP